MAVEIVRHVAETEWRRFLDGCSDATLYHTPEWKTFLERTFGYPPHSLFAADDRGELIGLLPLCAVRSRLTGDRLCSVPFSHESGCLGEPIVCRALLGEAIELADRLRIGRIEVRDSVCHEDFRGVSEYSTYILDLAADPEETWARVHRGARRAVRKSARYGVTVTTSTEIEDLRAFYELNRINKRNLGVPCHPWVFFENLFSCMGDSVRLYLSHYEGRIVAGGIMEYYKDRIVYGYGAADPGSLHVHPYYAFIWKSIEDGCTRGYRSYDFGRVFNADAGLIRFKARWGTSPKPLCSSYYPASTGPSMPDRGSSRFRLAKTVMQRMPMPVYSKFSEAVFRHLG